MGQDHAAERSEFAIGGVVKPRSRMVRAPRLSTTALLTFMIVPYIGLMGIVAVDPVFLARPITPGRHVTIGLAIGAGIIFTIIILSMLHTRWTNAAERLR